jgi:hypothetical protein
MTSQICTCGHIRFHHSHDKNECIEQNCPCKKFKPVSENKKYDSFVRKLERSGLE